MIAGGEVRPAEVLQLPRFRVEPIRERVFGITRGRGVEVPYSGRVIVDSHCARDQLLITSMERTAQTTP